MSVLYGNEITPLNISLTRFGELYCSQRWSSKTGTPMIYSTRLYFIEEGAGWLKTETQYLPLEPGYAYLIPAALYHEYGCSGMRKMYFIARIRANSRRDLTTGLDKLYRTKYDPKDLEALLACYEKNDFYSLMQLRMLVLKYVMQALQENGVPSPPSNPHSALVEKAIKYIYSNLRCDLKVQELCEALYVSESKLRSTFYSETGTNIGTYIDNLVMQKAKDMLATPSLSIAQIAAALNFCDQFYFSRKFKSHFGKAPTVYRKELFQKQSATNRHDS